MWAWLMKYLITPIGRSILLPYLAELVGKAIAWAVEKYRKRKTNKKNVEEYENKMENGTDEERIDAATDMLNGNKPSEL